MPPDRQPLVHRNELVAVNATDFLAFLCSILYQIVTEVARSFQLGIGYALERWVVVTGLHHPLMQLVYIGDCIDDATLGQQVRIVGQ